MKVTFEDVHLCIAIGILAVSIASVAWVGWYDTKEERKRKAFEQGQRDRFKALLPPGDE